ncbi:TetR/AcrR family transcriptional regulator [Leptospirillum ferriphilum]|uniref:TetR family transcriptional regulator n=1 Tax=Leptospirillum ferriphilum YSK TaxID=1441628 RepID=A0A059XVD1_9BACT|nr:TetR/AcrR family transcriptional regulator [Leptospirillum ferriphilum]AIA30793.1 TetR family transcriptional regulator [Leptospirillum ferriphilum YSK]
MEMTTDTTELILDAAQELVQLRGFNAFSYRDIADRIGIRTASIHYHFPRKDDLARSLIRRYHDRFLTALRRIGGEDRRPETRLTDYMALFSSLLAQGDRLCLFAVFSADLTSLSGEVREEVRAFYDTNVDWLRHVLEEGRRTGAFGFSGSSGEIARGIFALLEGEILVTRAFPAPSPVTSMLPIVRSLLAWTDEPLSRGSTGTGPASGPDEPHYPHS